MIGLALGAAGAEFAFIKGYAWFVGFMLADFHWFEHLGQVDSSVRMLIAVFGLLGSVVAIIAGAFVGAVIEESVS